jgi:hypothetical protein
MFESIQFHDSCQWFQREDSDDGVEVWLVYYTAAGCT